MSCENSLKEVDKLTAQEKKTQEEISKGVEIIYSDSALVRAKLYSPLLKHISSNDPYLVMPIGLHVDFYDKNLVIDNRLSAKYGIRYESRKLVELKNNVIVTNNKGERLDTELLNWDESRQRLFSDKFVKITTPDKVIYGEGFESNQSFTKYKIFKIKGMVDVKAQSLP